MFSSAHEHDPQQNTKSTNTARTTKAARTTRRAKNEPNESDDSDGPTTRAPKRRRRVKREPTHTPDPSDPHTDTDTDTETARQAKPANSTISTISTNSSNSSNSDDETTQEAKRLHAKRVEALQSVDDDLKKLNDEQRRAVSYARDGHNVFMTGGGGVGKTFCLRVMVAVLKRAGRRVVVTATTGKAALLVDGVTIHSFAGVGLGTDSIEDLAKRARGSKLRGIWKGVDTLVIDEVSMLTPAFLERLDVMAQAAREDQNSFGGVQVIFVGDFFQLPPVYRYDEQPKDDEPEFCFESETWRRTINRVVMLEEVYRQRDQRFVETLNRCRVGQPTREDFRLLQSRVGHKLPDNGIEPTHLFPHCKNVDKMNEERLDELRSDTRTFRMRSGVYVKRFKEDYAEMDPENCRTIEEALEEAGPALRARIVKTETNLKKNCSAASEITLKVGAQVALLSNLSQENELVNGSRGVVESFMDSPPHFPIVRFAKCRLIVRPQIWTLDINSRSFVYVAQIPLQLAYAFTIHKIQGASLDCAEIDLGKRIFQAGQAYVALSRVRRLNCLTLKAFAPESIRANPRVVRFYRRLERARDRARDDEPTAPNTPVSENEYSMQPYDSD